MCQVSQCKKSLRYQGKKTFVFLLTSLAKTARLCLEVLLRSELEAQSLALALRGIHHEVAAHPLAQSLVRTRRVRGNLAAASGSEQLRGLVG